MLSVPESVIRAVAAAPKSHIRDVVLAAIGLDSSFEPVSEEERQSAIDELHQLMGEAPKMEELPF